MDCRRCRTKRKISINPDAANNRVIGVAGTVFAQHVQIDYEPTDSKDAVRKAELDAISARLDALGFKSGSFTIPSGWGEASVNTLQRQGNYVFGIFKLNTPIVLQALSGAGAASGTIQLKLKIDDNDFKPKAKQEGTVGIINAFTDSSKPYVKSCGLASATIDTSGNIEVSYNCEKYSGTGGVTDVCFTGISFGYEAAPRS